MGYLSSFALSTPLTPTLLLVHPYWEAKRNIALAFGGKDISWIQRCGHAAAGVVLSIPLINSIALLVLHLWGKSHLPSFTPTNARFEEAFNPLQDRPLESTPSNLSVRQLARGFSQQIFNEFMGEQNEKGFTVVALLPEGYLAVHYRGQEIALKELLNHIDWHRLGEKWEACSQEELQIYLDRSLVFEAIRAEDPSLFRMPEPFIRCYTTYGFYAWLNPLLRKGILIEGRLPFATQETHQQFFQKNSDVIDRVVKELLFISMMAAARLSALPSRYKAECRVIRMAYVPSCLFEELEEGAKIVERGFMSASALGGIFAGGGPCSEECTRVKFIIYSKNGKFVQNFSQLPENEVLFKPFTAFKVLHRSGSRTAGYRVELEEV